MESGKKLLVGTQGDGEAMPSGLHEHMSVGNKRDLPSELGDEDLALLGSVPRGREQWGPRYILFFAPRVFVVQRMLTPLHSCKPKGSSNSRVEFGFSLKDDAPHPPTPSSCASKGSKSPFCSSCAKLPFTVSPAGYSQCISSLDYKVCWHLRQWQVRAESFKQPGFSSNISAHA